MAFTKITAAGIGSTETVTLDGVDVINNESIGGNLTVTGNATIGGVLTYEDVTNVDSIGIVTARAGVYTLTYNLSLYVENDTGGDNSVGWGFLKNQTKLNWNTYDSGLSISQSTPYVIGANSGDTLTNAFEIGAPHLTIITTLAANDEIQVGWDNMSKILGVRSFIFSGHLLG